MIKQRLTIAPSSQILDRPIPFLLSGTSKNLVYEDRRWKLLNLKKDEHFFNDFRMLRYRPYENIKEEIQIIWILFNLWEAGSIIDQIYTMRILYMIKNIDQYSNQTSTISIKLFLWCILLRFYYCQMHKGFGCWMLLFWLTVRTSNYSHPL